MVRATYLVTCAAATALLAFAGAGHAQTDADIARWRAEARTYEHGEGVARDSARAVELYCRAARHGDVESHYSLGWLYANSRGVAKDDASAAHFFTHAASRGHDQAAAMLKFVGTPATRTPQCLLPDAAPLAVPPATVASARDEPSAAFVPANASQRKALEIVNSLAPRFGVRPRLALAIIRAESNFDADARSPKNAQGLMQLIPDTAVRFNVSKPYDPVQSIRGGLAYLQWLLAYFEGDVSLVAAAYNAGEGAVNRHRGVPPYAETRAYVQRIVQLFGATEHAYDAKVTDASPELGNIRKAAARFTRSASLALGGQARTQ